MTEKIGDKGGTPIEYNPERSMVELDKQFREVEAIYRSLSEQETRLFGHIFEALEDKGEEVDVGLLTFLEKNLDVLRLHREETDEAHIQLIEKMERLREQAVQIQEERNSHNTE